MASNALNSQGAVIKRGDGGGTEVFTAIPEVKSISGPTGSASIIDVTNLDSTAREKRLGLKDEGQVTLEISYIPTNAQHDGLLSDRTNKTLRNFQIHFTDSPASIFNFSAYVTGFSVSMGVDQVSNASVTLEITGAVTRT